MYLGLLFKLPGENISQRQFPFTQWGVVVFVLSPQADASGRSVVLEGTGRNLSSVWSLSPQLHGWPSLYLGFPHLCSGVYNMWLTGLGWTLQAPCRHAICMTLALAAGAVQAWHRWCCPHTPAVWSHTLSARQDFLSFRSSGWRCAEYRSSRETSAARSLPLNTHGTTTGATSRPCTKPASESQWAVLPPAVWVPSSGRTCFSSLQLAHCFLIVLEDGLAGSQRVRHCSCITVSYLMCFLGWVMNKFRRAGIQVLAV